MRIAAALLSGVLYAAGCAGVPNRHTPAPAPAPVSSVVPRPRAPELVFRCIDRAGFPFLTASPWDVPTLKCRRIR